MKYIFEMWFERVWQLVANILSRISMKFYERTP